MDDMQYFWQNEFEKAFEMLCDVLYTVKGYSYSDEIGNGGINQDLRDNLIDIKWDIKKDRRNGRLHDKFKYYAILIYRVIRVE